MQQSIQAAALTAVEARDRNLAAVFQAIRESEGISRSEIGRTMPFSLQTMTNVVQELISLGMVEESRRQANGRKGSPHRGLQIVGGRAHALGMRLSWDSCTMVLAGLDLQERAEKTAAIKTIETQAYLAEVIGHVIAFLAEHPDKEVWAGGIAVPLTLGITAPVAPAGLEARPATPDNSWYHAFWREISPAELERRLNAALPFPVTLLNNPQAAALAEAALCPPASRFVYLHLGYGLGSALVGQRALSQDIWPHGGEIGHIVLNGKPIGTTLSMSGLRRTLAFDVPQGELERLVDEALADDSPALRQWFDEAGDILRFIVNFLENAIWPDGIRIGGFPSRLVLERLVGTALPLTPSVVPDADDAARVLPRLALAHRSSEAIPLGAAIGLFDTRSNPGFAQLVGKVRREG